MSVVRIASAKWPEIANALSELLERAKRGEIQSVAISYESDAGYGHRYVLGKDCNTMALIGETHAMATLMVLDVRKEH